MTKITNAKLLEGLKEISKLLGIRTFQDSDGLSFYEDSLDFGSRVRRDDFDKLKADFDRLLKYLKLEVKQPTEIHHYDGSVCKLPRRIVKKPGWFKRVFS